MHCLERNERIEGVDVVRGIAAISVVLIHSFILPAEFSEVSFFVRMIFARFAVPFFFIVSGYFYARGVSCSDANQQFKKSFLRLSSLYIFWTVIHFLNPNFHEISQYGFVGFYSLKAIELIDSKGWLWLFFVGPTPHLWFFVALVSVIVIFHVLRFHRNIHVGLVVSFLVYSAGVLNGPYRNTPIGINLHFNTSYFIFPGMFTFSLGYFFFKEKLRWYSFSSVWGFLLFSLGMVLHFGEGFYLESWYGVKFHHDYLFSTFLMGVGAFVFGCCKAKINREHFGVRLGGYSLGIYLLQSLVVCRLGKFFDLLHIGDRVGQVVAPFFIVLFAVLVTHLMRRLFPKPMVSVII